MATFRYAGRSVRGDAVRGSLDAETPEALANHLLARGITPTDIKPVGASHDAVKELWERLGGGRPKLNDLILFARQMYAITKAGLPLLRGMRSIADSTPNTFFRAALELVIADLQSGRDLASSLARHPEIFSKFFVSIVRVGESSGTLETAFMRMYEYLGMEKRIRDKLSTALRYPLTVVVAIAIAVAIITRWAMPPDSWNAYRPAIRSASDSPIVSSSSSARRRASRWSRTPCAVMISSTCWPIVSTGFSPAIASWKIIEMSRPRRSRSSLSSILRTLRPLK